MLKMSLCLLSDGSYHFTLRVTNSLPHINMCGGTWREECGFEACRNRLTLTLTHQHKSPSLFQLNSHSQFLLPTHMHSDLKNSKHSASAHIPSTALKRMADYLRGYMCALVFAHIDGLWRFPLMLQ